MSLWANGRRWIARMSQQANDHAWQQRRGWETWREARELGHLSPLAADVLLRLMKRNPYYYPWVSEGRVMVHLPAEWGAPEVDMTAAQFHTSALIAQRQYLTMERGTWN